MRLFNILKALAKRDHIVEEGTSGIWTYRKWSSGIAECWGEYSATRSSYVSLGNNWYGYYSDDVNLPFTFTQKPWVNYQAQIAQNMTMQGSLLSISTTSVRAYAMAYNVSGSTTMVVDFNVKGRWK